MYANALLVHLDVECKMQDFLSNFVCRTSWLTELIAATLKEFQNANTVTIPSQPCQKLYVSRFGQISPLWQVFRVYWVLAKITFFGKLFCYWAKFNWCKWPNSSNNLSICSHFWAKRMILVCRGGLTQMLSAVLGGVASVTCADDVWSSCNVFNTVRRSCDVSSLLNVDCWLNWRTRGSVSLLLLSV